MTGCAGSRSKRVSFVIEHPSDAIYPQTVELVDEFNKPLIGIQRIRVMFQDMQYVIAVGETSQGFDTLRLRQGQTRLEGSELGLPRMLDSCQWNAEGESAGIVSCLQHQAQSGMVRADTGIGP